MSLKKPKLDKEYSRTLYILMTKFHWTPDEIRKLKLSTLSALTKLMEWERKEMERNG
jgi:hypothetical protein